MRGGKHVVDCQKPEELEGEGEDVEVGEDGEEEVRRAKKRGVRRELGTEVEKEAGEGGVDDWVVLALCRFYDSRKLV